MSRNEDWVECKQCGTKLNEGDKRCPKCSSTEFKKAHFRSANLAIGLRLYTNSRFRRWAQGIKKFIKEIVQGRLGSGSPDLSEGVDKHRIIDRARNEYHEVVKDAKTGRIIHETHEPLSQHKHLPTGRS